MKFSRVAVVFSACGLMFMAGCGGCGKAKVAKTPDKAVMQAAKAVQDNHPEVLFQALPPSYQNEIESLVSDAAKRMDPEIWDASKDLMKTALKVAKKHKKLILQTEMFAHGRDKDEVSKNFDNSIKLMSAFLKSDFANIKKLQKAKIEKMLASDGSDIMKLAKSFADRYNKEEMDAIYSVKATLVSQGGDTAKVKIEAKDEPTEEIDFVKVEGHWIPKDMKDEFPEMISDMKEAIAEIDFSSADGKKTKAMILTQIGVVKSALDSMEKAKTKEELEGVLQGLMMNSASMLPF